MYNNLSSISSTKKDFALIGRLSLSLLCHFEALYNAEVPGLWTVTGFNVYCFLKASTSKGSKSPAKVGEGGSSGIDFKMVSSGLTENQLQLSVEVLTSHSCSEEGLEDAANVLLQLSRGDSGTRDTVLKLLLNGARHLGYTLCKQIGTLLAELREYNLEQQRRAHCEALSPDGLPEEQPQTTKLKGKMQSRWVVTLILAVG